MAFEPLEINALPRHLLALLAHLLALARAQGIEEILKVPVATVLPVKLAAQALQPARLLLQGRVAEIVGEVDMGTGKSFDLQVAGQAFQQFERICLGRCQHPGAAHRAERHRRQQLGVVVDSGPVAGIRPAMIEHVFAVGMPFAIAGQRRQQPTVFDMQQVLGLPARARAKAAAVFQGTEKGVAHKGLPVLEQAIPLRRIDGGQAVQGLQRSI